MKGDFEALERLCHSQGTTLGTTLTDDRAGVLIAELAVSDLGRFFDDLAAVTTEANANLVIDLNGRRVRFFRTENDRWMPDDPEVVSGLVSPLHQDTWSSLDLEDALAGQDHHAEVELRVDKRSWRNAVHESCGRSSWIGYSEASFTRWLQTSSWRQVAMELFSEPGAIVLLFTWQGRQRDFAERLIIGSLEAQEPLTGAPADIRWPQQAEPELIRAAHLRVADEESKWSASLARVAGACAAQLLQTASWTQRRQDEGLSIAWPLNDPPEVEPSGVLAVLSLVNWVTRDPMAIRLDIAWRTAAERIDDPFDGPPAEQILSIAERAYRSVIGGAVRDASSLQAQFERTLREMGSMTQSIDGTVTRAIAAVFAIGIATITAEEFRGWVILAAGSLIALYLAYEATFVLAAHKRNIESCLDVFVAQGSGGEYWGESFLIAQTMQLRSDIRKRVRTSRLALMILALGVFLGAAVTATHV